MNSVVLLGADDVARAGSAISSAAREMSQAASNLAWPLEQHQRFMDEWLGRFEEVLNGRLRKALEEIASSVSCDIERAVTIAKEGLK